MSESAAKHYLVSFENVSASIGGSDISSIVELQLVAAANAVPQVTLLVDVGPGFSQVAKAVSLSDARMVLDACRALMRTDAATLSLSLTCRLDGPGGTETQTLSLNGWMLTDVAVSPVQRRGVCMASLTFKHPLYKAHLGGAVPALVAIPPVLDDMAAGNPLDVFTRALQAYSAAQRVASLPAAIPGAVAPERMRSELLKRLDKAVSDLTSHVRWTHGSLPAVQYLGGWGDLICKGLAIYATPGGGNSVLQALLGSIVPECSLALGGDYTHGQLELGPFEPWAPASLTISDSDIVTLDFPQSDPAPLSGVHMVMSATDSGLGVSYHPIGCQMGAGAYPAETFYVPESELKAQYLYGPIQQFEEPGWLVAMSMHELGLFGRAASDTVLAPSGGLRTATNTPRGEGASFGAGSTGGGSSIDYSNAMLACAKAYFETTLMKDWSFTVESRLMFSTQGGVICPGRVIGVKAGGGEVLGGYVTGVEHVISVPSKAATTRVTCTHPRFGKLPDAITSTTNALYT